jgi:hypothetical protein
MAYHPDMRTPTARVLRTGFVAGILGFASVAAGFFLFDLITGRGIGFTPSLLAGALFRGVTDACTVQPAFPALAGYTVLHLLIFLALGWFSAWLFALTAARPWFYTGALLAFIIVTVHLYAAVLTLLAPVRDCFSLYHVLGATALAAVVMLAYLLRKYRGLTTTVPRPENQ